MPIDSPSLPFDPADPKAALAQLPQTPAVFALYGEEAHFEPYIGRTPNLRGRLERLLQPSAKHPRRLQLAVGVHGQGRRRNARVTGAVAARKAARVGQHHASRGRVKAAAIGVGNAGVGSQCGRFSPPGPLDALGAFE